SFGATTPSVNKVLYQWVNDDGAYNPVVAVDDSLPATVDDPNHPGEKVSFVDPETKGTQADLLATTADRLYLAWNSNNTAPASGANGFNPNVIKMVGSGDGGTTFSTQMTLNDSRNFGTDRDSFPTLAVAQGTASDRAGVTPGPLLTVTNVTRVGPNAVVTT